MNWNGLAREGVKVRGLAAAALMLMAVGCFGQTFSRTPAFIGVASRGVGGVGGGPVDYSLPPTNALSKDPNNPIIFTGNAASHNVLIETPFYDTNTGRFFAVGYLNSGTAGVGLFMATNPCYSGAWSYVSNLVNSSANSTPCMFRWGTNYYLVYGNETNIVVSSNSVVWGPFINPRELIRTNQAAFDSARTTEAYMMANAAGNGFVLFYMVDAGGEQEQVSVATSSSANPDTGFVKYPGNPLIPYGSAGTYDSKTAADPSAVLWNGVYYIQYAAQQFTNVAGYTQIAMARTADLTNIVRLGVQMGTNASLHTWDCTNVLRGGFLATPVSEPHFGTNRVWVMLYSGAGVNISAGADVGVAYCPADSLGPDFTNVVFLQTNQTSGNLTWITSIPSYGCAAYGSGSGSYGLGTNNEGLGSNFVHSANVTGLAVSNTYFFQARATNTASGTAASAAELSYTVFPWPAYEQSWSTNVSGSVNKINSPSQTMVGGECVVVGAFINDNTSTVSQTDTLGLTWTKATNVVYNGNSQQIFLYYATNCPAGTLRVTNTYSTSQAFNGMSVSLYTNVAVSAALDAFTTTTGTTSSGTPVLSASTTTTQPGDMAVAIYAASSVTWSANSPWTKRESNLSTFDGTVAAAGSFQTSATSDNGGHGYGVIVATFKHK